MLLRKSLTYCRFFKLFMSSDRCVSRLPSKFELHVPNNILNQPKQISSCRYITNCVEERKDASRVNIIVPQALISYKYLRLIKNAVRESGPVAENNQKLAAIIKNAQKHLSSEYIDFAIKMSCNVRAKVGLYDLILTSGCHFVIQYEDIDQTMTKHHLMVLSDRYDGMFMQGEVKWSQNFDQKGIIAVRCNETDPLSNQSDETLLSKIGAEFLQKEIDFEDSEYWKIYCDPWELHNVKEKLNKITQGVEESYVGYVPREKINVSSQMKNYFCNIFMDLCKVPTIDNVYVNLNLFNENKE